MSVVGKLEWCFAVLPVRHAYLAHYLHHTRDDLIGVGTVSPHDEWDMDELCRITDLSIADIRRYTILRRVHITIRQHSPITDGRRSRAAVTVVPVVG